MIGNLTMSLALTALLAERAGTAGARPTSDARVADLRPDAAESGSGCASVPRGCGQGELEGVSAESPRAL